MKKPPRRAVFLFGPALREGQSRMTCSARRVKVCSSMATWERKSGSLKYFAWTGQRRTQDWHLMHSPTASML